jgi:hypothetical protein
MNQPHGEPKAPESVGWYIELAKWLIGISAATLVFGFDKLRLSELSFALKLTFWVSALLLAVSVGCGLLCCYQFIAYANRKENGLKSGETEATVTGYRDLGTKFYAGCAGSLWFGILLFALVWAIATIGGTQSEPPAAAPVLLALPQKPSALMLRPDAHGQSFMLTRAADGSYGWKAILVPPQGAPARASPGSLPTH